MGRATCSAGLFLGLVRTSAGSTFRVSICAMVANEAEGQIA
jgi:hypothetical protein